MKKVVLGLMIVLGFGLNGCSSGLYDAIDIRSHNSEATIEKMRHVKFMPDNHVPRNCKYLSQISREGVAYSMQEAKASAQRYLMLDAAKLNGNVVAVTDRLVTKNKMTKKIDLTASIYRCK